MSEPSNPSQSDELLNALANNNPRSANNDRADMEVYRLAGKKAAALLNPFAVPQKAFITGIQHDKGGNIDSSTPQEIERDLHFYEGILKLVPGLRNELGTISPTHLNKIIRAITKGISDGRSQDLSTVKQKGLEYVPSRMSDGLVPPIQESESKSNRGIFHPQLARLMCPCRYVGEFDEDEDAGMEALENGDFPMTARRWPMLFYEEETYDPEDIQAGLLRHHTVKRVYHRLFDGPSAVNGDTTARRAKPAKNVAWGLSSVDSHIIAYVHVITYITISHAQQWTTKLGDMDLEELYWRIIKLLEDESDPWVQDTLAWWNWQYKSSTGRKQTKRTLDDDEDDMAVFFARKKAKATMIKKKATEADDPFSDELDTAISKEGEAIQHQAPAKHARRFSDSCPTSEFRPRTEEHATTRLSWEDVSELEYHNADSDTTLTWTNKGSETDRNIHGVEDNTRNSLKFTAARARQQPTTQKTIITANTFDYDASKKRAVPHHYALAKPTHPTGTSNLVSGSRPQVSVNTAIQCTTTEDIPSPQLSDLTDDDNNNLATTWPSAVPKPVQTDIESAPLPKKKAKKASTAPTKRNPTRKIRANGF